MADAVEISEAVHGYFSGSDVLQYLTGGLRDYTAIAAAIDKDFAGTLQSTRNILRVEVVEIRDGIAFADVDAEIAHEAVAGDGKQFRWVDKYVGPVELCREEGRWKVADLLKNGVSLREATFKPGISDAVGGLTVRVLAGRRQATWTRLLCEVVSDLDRPTRVTGTAFAYRHPRWPWRWSDRVSISLKDIQPGVTSFMVDGDLPDWGLGTDVRFVLQTEAGLLDVRPAGTRGRATLPGRPRLLLSHVTAWSALSSATMLAAVIAVGIATNIAGASLMLLITAGGLSASLTRATQRWFPRPRSKTLRRLIALTALALFLIAAGGVDYATQLDLSSSMATILWPLLVVGIGLVGTAVARRVPERWSRGRPWIWIASLAATLGAFAFFIVSTAPVSKAETAEQEQLLGRIAIDALRTGDVTQLRRYTYSGYQHDVIGEFGLARIAVRIFPFNVLGPSSIRKGRIEYTLRPRSGKGAFQLIVESSERNRQQWIWRLTLGGNVHRTTTIKL